MNLLGGSFGGGLVGAPILNEAVVVTQFPSNASFNQAITIPFDIVDKRRVFVELTVWTTSESNGSGGSSVTTLHTYNDGTNYCANNQNIGINDSRRLNAVTDDSDQISIYNSGGNDLTSYMIAKVVEYDITVDFEEVIDIATTSEQTAGLVNTVTDIDKVLVGTYQGSPTILNSTEGFNTSYPTFFYFHGNGTGADTQAGCCLSDASTVKQFASSVAAWKVLVRQYSW